MTEKQLRSLSKPELLEMMHQQGLEIERLSGENEEMSKKLDERRLSVEQAGSLAEASMMLSGVMKAAQDAADVYLDNIRNIESEKAATAQELEREAMERTVAIYAEAERRRAGAEDAAKQIVANAERFLNWYAEQLAAMREGFREMVDNLGLMGTTGADGIDIIDGIEQ